MEEPRRGTLLSVITFALLVSSLVNLVSGQDEVPGPAPQPAGTPPEAGTTLPPPPGPPSPGDGSDSPSGEPSPNFPGPAYGPDSDPPDSDPNETGTENDPTETGPDTPPPNEAGPSDPKTVRWCTVSAGEQQFCGGVVQDLENLVNDPDYNWECTKRTDAFDCMRAIMLGEADLITLEAGLAYVAFTNYTMKAVMGEYYRAGETVPATYQSVALVRKSLCDKDGLRLKDFRGKTSCHAGYRTSSGWDVPLSILNNLGLLKPVVVDDKPTDVAMIEDFFGKSCSAGDTVNSTICSACPDHCDDVASDIGGDYIGGDLGALRCLANDGDIAFVKAGLLPDFQCGGARNPKCGLGLEKLDIGDYRVLCEEQGGCGPPSASTCKLGVTVGHAVMVQNQADSAKVAYIIQTLERIKPGSTFFSESNPYDYLFSAMARGVAPLPNQMLTREYLSYGGSGAGVAGSTTSSIEQGLSGEQARHGRVGILTLVIAVLPFLLSCFAS